MNLIIINIYLIFLFFFFRYPMEMHIVHKNKIYSNLSNALNYKDGLVVLGIFFQVSFKKKILFLSIKLFYLKIIFSYRKKTTKSYIPL